MYCFWIQRHNLSCFETAFGFSQWLYLIKFWYSFGQIMANLLSVKNLYKY